MLPDAILLLECYGHRIFNSDPRKKRSYKNDCENALPKHLIVEDMIRASTLSLSAGGGGKEQPKRETGSDAPSNAAQRAPPVRVMPPDPAFELRRAPLNP